ncbi:MAG: hypothetical protein IJH38_00810 [Clostridia bacterium]|nr:hypothetical protein [Clostridia bacterium]
MPEIRRAYRDRLFSFIFGSEEHREWTLSLYNAVNGTHYDDPSAVEITTIREALYLGMHNDVSFLIANLMNLYEQQSTFNPNMPLRMLQYTGNIYEKYVTVNRRNKYGKTLVQLPVPKLVVFYNGKDEMPDEQVLELSDAFAPAQRDASDIRVRVRMINVNRGRSPELQSACRPLMEYAWIVDKVHELEEGRELSEAIDLAIEAIPGHFATKIYLEAHRLEVKTMLLTEYDEVRQMELFKEEGREEGRQEGKAEERSLISRILGQLLAAGKIEEARRATEDPEYMEQLVRQQQHPAT